MKFLKFIIFIILSFVSPPLLANHVQAIIVGDTLSDIDNSIPQDLDKIEKGVREIADSLGKESQIHLLMGQAVQRERVLRELQTLETDDSDIVIFYFTGHGYRTPTKTSQWPFLYTKNDDSAIDLDEVITILTDKPGRFKLIMAECCNVLPSQYDKIPRKKPVRAESVRETLSNCAVDTLFGEASGMLVLSSSTPGEFSWSTERGGLFTQALYNTLATGCKNGTFRWDQVLKNIQQKTAKYQKPQLAWFSSQHA